MTNVTLLEQRTVSTAAISAAYPNLDRKVVEAFSCLHTLKECTTEELINITGVPDIAACLLDDQATKEIGFRFKQRSMAERMDTDTVWCIDVVDKYAYIEFNVGVISKVIMIERSAGSVARVH